MEQAAGPRGARLLTDPLLNQGTAFTPDRRHALGLQGLLPPVVETIEEQRDRALVAMRSFGKPLNQHVYLRQLQDTNETLFARLVADNVAETLPIVYTPTVGLACQTYSENYRRPRGLFVSYEDRGRVREVLRNRPRPEVDVIVVTDGERILGLGDLGAGGMGIPIGKLSLYTAIGGIDPARTLPVFLDVGTDNEALLADPRYVGRRQHRVRGQDYDDFVEEFVTAVQAELPGVLLQWEDFATTNARPLLDRYRDRLLTFNDDIQGTAVVALGALSTALVLSGTRLRDQTVVMLGAGSAAMGVADMIRTAMVGDGATPQEAADRFWVVDVDGLLVRSRTDLTPAQREFARADVDVEPWGLSGPARLADVVRETTTTVLIGLSTVQGAFTEDVVREMAAKVDRPVVFPLSNPTSRAEAEPDDLMTWTGGRALVASGSPFAPVEVDGHQVPVAQSNNVYVFPALGLAVTAARATRVTDGMLVAAARAIGEAAAREAHDDVAPLLPPIDALAGAADGIALAAALAAVADGVAPPATHDELVAAIARTRWRPVYPAE